MEANGNILRPSSPAQSLRELPVNFLLLEKSLTELHEKMKSAQNEVVCALSSRAIFRMESGDIISDIGVSFYWCSFCHFKTEDKQRLISHLLAHRFSCKFCSFQAYSRVDIIRHSLSDHPEFEPMGKELKFCMMLVDFLQLEKIGKGHCASESVSSPPDGSDVSGRGNVRSSACQSMTPAIATVYGTPAVDQTKSPGTTCVLPGGTVIATPSPLTTAGVSSDDSIVSSKSPSSSANTVPPKANKPGIVWGCRRCSFQTKLRKLLNDHILEQHRKPCEDKVVTEDEICSKIVFGECVQQIKLQDEALIARKLKLVSDAQREKSSPVAETTPPLSASTVSMQDGNMKDFEQTVKVKQELVEMDVKPEVALLPVLPAEMDTAADCPESQQVEPAAGTEDSSSLGMLQCLHCDFTDASPSQICDHELSHHQKLLLGAHIMGTSGPGNFLFICPRNSCAFSSMDLQAFREHFGDCVENVPDEPGAALIKSFLDKCGELGRNGLSFDPVAEAKLFSQTMHAEKEGCDKNLVVHRRSRKRRLKSNSCASDANYLDTSSGRILRPRNSSRMSTSPDQGHVGHGDASSDEDHVQSEEYSDDLDEDFDPASHLRSERRKQKFPSLEKLGKPGKKFIVSFPPRKSKSMVSVKPLQTNSTPGREEGSMASSGTSGNTTAPASGELTSPTLLKKMLSSQSLASAQKGSTQGARAAGTPATTSAASLTNSEVQVKVASSLGKTMPDRYKCSQCRATQNSLSGMKRHMEVSHRGHPLFALDLDALVKNTPRFLIFCHSQDCEFASVDREAYLKHVKACIPWLDGDLPEGVTEDRRNNIKTTIKFVGSTLLQLLKSTNQT